MSVERAHHTRKAITIIVFIVTAFTICVFPQHAVNIFFEFLSRKKDGDGEYFDRRTLDDSTYYYLQIVAKLPYPLHVAINPLIYSLVDSGWRKDVRNVVMGIFRKNRRMETITKVTMVISTKSTVTATTKMNEFECDGSNVSERRKKKSEVAHDTLQLKSHTVDSI